MSAPALFQAVARSDKARRLQALLREKAQAAKTRCVAAADSAFLRDAQLDPAIQPCGVAWPISSARAVLLTGATGFLGAHLLHDLCRLTNAIIYCLVRADGPAQAKQRLEENLVLYSGTSLPPGRVVPVTGDLAKPKLGLPAACFERLAREIDAIFHNGAVVNHLARYDRLRAPNVMSTAELLRLAGSRKPKWMYYVSSMIAATERNPEGELVEQLPTADTSELAHGYAQSKWVSERLLAEAHRRGFGVTAYRPGIISGRRDTGAWATAQNHLLLLIKSCVQMGYASASPLVVDLTPVDFVSEAIVRLSLAGPPNTVVHLSNPNPVPWTTLVAWIKEFGYPLRLIPFEVWQKNYLANSGESNALFPLLPLYLEESIIKNRELLIAKLAKVSRQFTVPMLAALNLDYPPIEKSLWQRYVQYCTACGFLPAARTESDA